MQCPKCGFTNVSGAEDCLRCGVIFAKYRPPVPHKPASAVNSGSAGGFKGIINGLLLHVESSINPIYFYGRALVYIGLIVWGISLIATPMERFYDSGWFIHNVNLAFHEAGHTIFRVFGHFIYVLGGSLGQVLVPLICLFVLLIKTRDPFGASICMWWAGENLMDVAVYVNDARALALPLIGGIIGFEDPSFHDWHVILDELNMLHYDRRIASALYGTGILLMLTAFAWGGLMLYLQFRRVQGDDL